VPQRLLLGALRPFPSRRMNAGNAATRYDSLAQTLQAEKGCGATAENEIGIYLAARNTQAGYLRRTGRRQSFSSGLISTISMSAMAMNLQLSISVT